MFVFLADGLLLGMHGWGVEGVTPGACSAESKAGWAERWGFFNKRKAKLYNLTKNEEP